MVKSEEDWKRNSKCFIFYYIYYWCLLLWWNCIKYIDPIYEFVRWLSLEHSGDVSCSDLFTQDIKSDQLLYSEIHLHLSLLACMTLVQTHWQSILYTIPSHILLYVVVCSKHLWINTTGVAKHEYTINSLVVKYVYWLWNIKHVTAYELLMLGYFIVHDALTLRHQRSYCSLSCHERSKMLFINSFQ